MRVAPPSAAGKAGMPMKPAMRELLLNSSGQYVLFYLLMNASFSGWGFFLEGSHLFLIAVLGLQIGFLAAYGNRPLPRFFWSLLAPAAYSALELHSEGITSLGNAAHASFWIVSVLTGAIQSLPLAFPFSKGARHGSEVALTVLNVTSFIFLYAYFDLKLSVPDGAAAEEIDRLLSLSSVAAGFVGFLSSDPSHLYIVFGGTLLAAGLAAGKLQILVLQERVADLLGIYVDERVRDQLLSPTVSASEKKDVSVLFSDIRNFTSMSERETPERITELLNEYFSEWDDAVRRHGGRIDKFIGDAVMAVFEDGGIERASRASVECAIEVLGKMPVLRASFSDRGFPDFAIGIGIHGGAAVVGDVGSRRRKNRTVIGDVVNTASRLEGFCKELGSPLTISSDTFRFLTPRRRADFPTARKVRPKGKEDGVEVRTIREDFPDLGLPRTGGRV